MLYLYIGSYDVLMNLKRYVVNNKGQDRDNYYMS